MQGEEEMKERKEEDEEKIEEEAKEKAAIADVEDDLRDLMNWVKVRNEEEVEGGTKKIEDDVANELIEKIKKIALRLGISTL